MYSRINQINFAISNLLYSAVLLNILGVFILVTITCLAGIVVFAYYAEKGCDPLTNGDVSNSNQVRTQQALILIKLYIYSI